VSLRLHSSKPEFVRRFAIGMAVDDCAKRKVETLGINERIRRKTKSAFNP